jgi:hypothetical protein
LGNDKDHRSIEQWAVIAPLIPPPVRRADGRSRLIEHNDRAIADGVL